MLDCSRWYREKMDLERCLGDKVSVETVLSQMASEPKWGLIRNVAMYVYEQALIFLPMICQDTGDEMRGDYFKGPHVGRCASPTSLLKIIIKKIVEKICTKSERVFIY